MNLKNILLTLAFLAFSQLHFTQSIDFQKSVDDYINYLSKENSFLGNIEMRKGNDILYSYSSSPFEPKNGQYKIGSITKTFTAVIVFQLIEEKKLNLDTKLSKFYPKVKNAEEITIENLLSHTSGIYNFTEWENYYSERSKNFTKDKVLNIIYSGKPAFKPNKDCIYSNSNYSLLGYIIEDITGKSFAANVKERITSKIDLEQTFVPQTAKEAENLNSYLFNGKNSIEDLHTDPGLTFSAGAIVSTTSDLNKFLDVLFHGNLVSKNSLSTMQNLRNNAIGHGLFKLPFYDKIGWGHSGRIDEFRSVTSYFPTEDLYLSIISNGTRSDLNDVMIGILSTYFNRKFEYPNFYHSEITNPPLTTFAGKYKAKLGGLITVGTFEITPAENNYLFVREINGVKLGEKALVERIDANNFYLRTAKGKLTFVLDQSNKVEKLVLEQGKMKINCTQVK